MTKLGLRTINNWLTAAVAMLAVYIVVMPFLPQLAWWVRHDAPIISAAPGIKAPEVTLPAPAASEPSIADAGETLIIPRLGMREAIYGGGMAALRKGVWRLPHTSTPDKGGNTVLVGHRFTYSGQAVFYHLDKVEVGDPIGMTWKGVFYRYRVEAVKVVPATELSIEANTDEPVLTIYTCTPLLTAKDRLVIQAKLVED